MYNLNDCGCGCNQSVTPNLPPTNNRCRPALESTDIQTLVWLKGLDANLCEKFQRLADVLSLRDCAGNLISLDYPLVTCADFRNQLCNALTLLASGGVANSQTLLVGADCKTYTLPVTTPGIETPNTVVDTSTIDFSATGTLGRVISGNVKVSDDVGNEITIRSDGLYASFTAPSVPTACQQIQAFVAAGDAVPGTVLVGADCLKYTYNPPIPPGFTVTDTAGIDLVLTGTNLSGNLRLDPNFIGRVTADGLELTCTDVLACAPPVTVFDTTTVNLGLTGQQLQADVRISTVPGNNLTTNIDGLYLSVCDALNDGPAPTPATPGVTVLVGSDCNQYTLPTTSNLTVIDTTTINQTLIGNQLQASVNVQPNTLLTTGPQGLQVTCETVQDCIFTTANNFWVYNDAGNSVAFAPSADSGNQIVVGTDGRPFVASPTDTITVTDTSCINLTITDGNISAVPIISPQPGNIIQCTNDGLFATATVDVGITAQDTNCIDLGVTEATPNNFVITAVPVISSDVGNTLECRVTGLYASPIGTIEGADTGCINITVNNDVPGIYTVFAEPVISIEVGNQLVCTDNGLYVPVTIVQAADSPCIDITVTESPANLFTISAAPIIDPDPCNSLQCRAGGLFVPEEVRGDADTVTSGPQFSGTLPVSGQFTTPDLCLSVTNPSSCRSAILTITFQNPATLVTFGTLPWNVRFESFIDTNLAPVDDTAGFVLLNSWELSSAFSNQGNPTSDVVRTFIVPPSFTGNYCMRWRITNVQGDATIDVSSVRLSYTLVTI